MVRILLSTRLGERRWTQADLARMTGIRPNTINDLYHITHIDNMPSILEHGLMSRSTLLQKNIYKFEDIANPDILNKRESYKTALSRYVPFHFYSRNPFDGAVCKKYGSENMAIITIRRDKHASYNSFVIPSHPLDRNEPDIYPYEQGFNLIKWDILDRETDRDYQDPEIRKACMAECIIDNVIPAKDFVYVYVSTEYAKSRIMHMGYSDKIFVQVKPYMFP